MRREGRAITIKITAGMIVQIISMLWASTEFVLNNIVDRTKQITYRTSMLIMRAAIRA